MSKPTRGYLTVSKTARYYLLGQQSSPKRIWYVAHGYGQLAADFVRHFESVSRNQLIVAPEGFSLFYLDSKYEKIGSSWLTQEDREQGIQDQVSYLETLHHHLLDSTDLTRVPVGLLGFSQGVATVARWARYGTIKPDRFVFWAGRLPQEWNGEDLSVLSKSHNLFVSGTRDAYLKPDWVAAEKEKCEHIGITYNQIQFDGGHRLDDNTIRQIVTPIP